MLTALVAVVVSQVVLAVLLFGTVAMDKVAMGDALDRHPLLPRRWREARTLRSYRRRLDRLGGAVERARLS
jgi:hypothetical protein